MTKSKSSNGWVGFIVRRSILHIFFGSVIGAIWGAMCIGVAGYIIGFVAGEAERNFLFSGSYSEAGGMIGLGLGGLTGGIIGLIGWFVTGIIAPPSRTYLPSDSLVRSTMGSMGLATILAVICYFAWCFGFGLFRYGFSAMIIETLPFAMFGVPAIMGIGQVIGIWRGVIKTRQEKQLAPPVSNSN